MRLERMAPRAKRRRSRFGRVLRGRRAVVLTTSALAIIAMVSTLATNSLASWVTTEFSTGDFRTRVLLTAELTVTGKTPIAVELEWTLPDAHGDERYIVERATSALGLDAVTVAEDLTDLSYTDEGPIAAVGGVCPTGAVLLGAGQCSLTQQADYWYRISYTLGSWVSQASDWVKVTIPAREALAPTVTVQASQLVLNWDPAPYGGISPVNYRLQRSLSEDGSDPNQLHSGTSRSATDKGGFPASSQPYQLAASANTTCGLTSAGEVWCWGGVATGTDVTVSTPANTPRKVPQVTEVLNGKKAVAIFAGNNNSFDLKDGGYCVIGEGGLRVACWGGYFSGFSAVSGKQIPAQPLVMAGIDGLVARAGRITQVAMAGASRCLLTEQSKVFCWGYAYQGQFGDGRGYSKSGTDSILNANSSYPTLLGAVLSEGYTIKKLVAGESHYCVLTAQGEVACWGNVSDAPISSITNVGNRPWLLVRKADGILGGQKIVDLDAGSQHLCALTETGTLACWGNRKYAQLGDGVASMSAAVPYTTTGAEPVVATKVMEKLQADGEAIVGIHLGGASADATYSRSCVQTSGGKLLCWGANPNGQLGDGTHITRAVPITTFTGLDANSSIATGKTHTCVQKGLQVFCVGENMYTKAGPQGSSGAIDTMTDAQVPMQPGCAPGAVLLADSTCSLNSDTTYYYRVIYTLNGLEVIGEWVPIRTSPG